MTGIWHRVFDSVTRGAEMRGVLVKSFALAVCSTLLALPYFHYLMFEVLSEGLNSWGLLFMELLLLFILCLLSSIIGLSFSKKFGLPGFGDPGSFNRSIPLLLTLGVVMISLSYFLFDRYFYHVSPLSYPKNALCLISLPFKGAFTEEIILRLCLVTLSVGFLKHKGAGVVLASVVATLFTIKYFHFIGIKYDLNYLFVTQLLLSFTAHLLLGYLFVTRGLIYAMALKFLFCIKYGVVSWAMRI